VREFRKMCFIVAKVSYDNLGPINSYLTGTEQQFVDDAKRPNWLHF